MKKKGELIESALLAIREGLDQQEAKRLSPLATLSREGLRRQPDRAAGHRQAFALDADRILHSRAYTRYIDKTQVFYMVSNDHITHRVLHVQLVSKIGRTIGRFLRLNEDLIEAIALGHDIGHPPFGHDGEKILAGLCLAHGLPAFQHNIQSVQFLDCLEKGGRGWNLTLQTLDGILCHDGEVHDRILRPHRGKGFADFGRELARKAVIPASELMPMSLEGCIVRLADTISYIGRDIEDAIELKLIGRSEIPADCRQVLGETNGAIVYRLVEDLIANGLDEDAVGFSPTVSAALMALKRFNYERIYLNPAIKKDFSKIECCYQTVFAAYLDQVHRRQTDAEIFTEFLNEMDQLYREASPPALVVRDFIAGMTDDYFLGRAARLGCAVPQKTRWPGPRSASA